MKIWPFEVSSLTREEIDEAVQDYYWQCIRRGMKGISTEEKLEVLALYKLDCKFRNANGELEREYEVQIDNYINALLRGGQLKRDSRGRIVVQRQYLRIEP